jgi:hypothetical protein
MSGHYTVGEEGRNLEHIRFKIRKRPKWNGSPPESRARARTAIFIISGQKKKKKKNRTPLPVIHSTVTRLSQPQPGRCRGKGRSIGISGRPWSVPCMVMYAPVDWRLTEKTGRLPPSPWTLTVP